VQGLALPQGVVPGEADQPLLASFAEQATKAGWTQDRFNEAVGWYYGLQDQLVGERQQADADYHLESTVELQREWGHEFKGNINQITAFFDAHFPKDLTPVLLNARMPDGSLVGNNPAINRAILEIAKTVNPVGAVLPNVPGATLANADQRIGEIEQKYMRAPQGSAEWKAYWQGENNPMQAELRNLYAARETVRERGRPAA